MKDIVEQLRYEAEWGQPTPANKNMMRHAANLIEYIRDENSRLRTRLEIAPSPFDKEDYDGISCRDDTIKLLDEKIDTLRAELAASREREAKLVEALKDVKSRLSYANQDVVARHVAEANINMAWHAASSAISAHREARP